VAKKSKPLASPQEVCQFLTQMFVGHKFDIRGLIKSDGEILPLPTESATLGNIIQSTLIRFMRDRCVEIPDLHITPAKSTRAYPDLSLTGPIFAVPKPIALDIKCARRETPNRIASKIAIATYDKYFREPEKKFPTLMAPYGSFWCHLDLIVLYDLVVAEVRNVDVFAVEGWRIASETEASGTRCYVGSVTDIARLKSGQGDFATIDDYYKYWRTFIRKPKKNPR
jgi:hypothetical protein